MLTASGFSIITGMMTLRAGFHHHRMIVGAGERGDGFRLSVVQHGAEIGRKDGLRRD